MKSFLHFLTLVAALATTTIANAAIVTVTTSADAGAGSLRFAVAVASPGDTIQFDPSLAGQTITLSGAIIINQPGLTIDGSTLARGVILSGGNSFSIFIVTLPAAVVLNSLTL